jgi:DNA-binding response OmpR family regulator
LKDRILIIEDDGAIVAALRAGFEHEGYAVEVASDGVAGLRLATEKTPSVIILDVMLPQLSGIDLCQKLRGMGNHVPIIMLTARSQEIDKVLGLKIGADDYVTKPFSLMELLARVEALLRRLKKSVVEIERYQFSDIVLDFKKLEATKDGCPLELTAREFAILKFFAQHEGRVVTREQLLDAVWGYENFPFTRTVDMHIAKLRHKIEANPATPRHLITMHRVGYKFVG